MKRIRPSVIRCCICNTAAGEDETGWGSQGHTGLIMDNLIAEGKAKPFIIVMANSYVPGAAGPGRGPAAAAQPVPLRLAPQTLLRRADGVPAAACSTSALSSGFSSTT